MKSENFTQPLREDFTTLQHLVELDDSMYCIFFAPKHEKQLNDRKPDQNYLPTH